MKLISIFSVILFSTFICATHDHLKEKNLGQYYAFNTEENPVCEEIKYHGKQVVKAPFKAVGYCVRKGTKTISKGAHEVELFLSPSRSVHGHRNQITDTLEDLQLHPEFENYVAEDRDAGQNILFAIPKGVASIVKNTVYTVFIRLPRGGWRTLKSFVHGTGDCTRI